MTPELARALHVYLARTPARVLVVQLEDVLGVQEQMNLPGTTVEHPNWCRKLPITLERIPPDERFIALTESLAEVRGVGSRARTRTARAGMQSSRRSQATIPRATYRLQLHRDFNFAQATALIPYLAALGVSHVYCSPYLRARPGSQHGYDIVDHSSFNPEIGGKEDFERFVATLEAHGMGHILDMVPNHMGVMGADNAWWMDVLENGPTSAYADYFDIDWDPIDPDLAGHVLVPVLGDHYAHVLERGELRLVYEEASGSFAVWYFEHRLPIDPREYPRILERAVGQLAPDALPADTRAELESLIAAFGHLPQRQAAAAQAVAERSRDKEVHKARLARLAREHSAARPSARTRGTRGERRGAARSPRSAGLSSRVLARRRRRNQLPSVLRCQRSRGSADGERSGVRGDAPLRSASWRRRARWTAYASIIPTGCSIRRNTFAACRHVTPSSHRWKATSARCTSSLRRSSRPTSISLRAGPCTARPAIGSRTS